MFYVEHRVISSVEYFCTYTTLHCMSDSKKAIQAFEEALRYLEFLKRKKCATDVEIKELCLRVNDFLVFFSKWKATAAVSANAHQLYMQTARLWEMVELSPSQWPE